MGMESDEVETMKVATFSRRVGKNKWDSSFREICLWKFFILCMLFVEEIGSFVLYSFPLSGFSW